MWYTDIYVDETPPHTLIFKNNKILKGKIKMAQPPPKKLECYYIFSNYWASQNILADLSARPRVASLMGYSLKALCLSLPLADIPNLRSEST